MAYAKEKKALPESIDYRPYVEKFEHAWANNNRDGIVALARPDAAARRELRDRLELRLAKHRIKGDWPELTDRNDLAIPPSNPQILKVYWSIPSARIRTVWVHEEGSWYLTVIMFKRPKRN